MATAVALGRELIRRKIKLAYGGGSVGLQRAVASTVFTNGGLVRGFIPGYIATRGVYGPTYGVEHTVSSNYYKYFEMNHAVEAFIILPGGVDTMEGLFTLISWASEGLHNRPIGLLNIDGYFNNLIKFLDEAVRQNFMASSQRKLFISSFFVDVSDSLPSENDFICGDVLERCHVLAEFQGVTFIIKLTYAKKIEVVYWEEYVNPLLCLLSIFANQPKYNFMFGDSEFVPNLSCPDRTYAEDIKALRLVTAIKTPYLPDGRFDLEAYDALVNMQIESGVEGVIVGGTTGEGQLMSWDEHIMLIGHTVNCFGGSIKVIGNTGSNSTREAIHATEQGFAVGMHAALHINPYYGKTSLEGMVSHFNGVLPMGPTIIYNVPSRTGQDIPPSVIHKVAKSPNLAGVKECVGNDRVEQYTSSGIAVWSGKDDECHDARWGHGATGVISVASNLVPGLMRQLMFGGKNPTLNAKLLPLIKWLFEQPNPIGLNTAMAQLGVARPIFRLPYVPLPKAKREEFVKIVTDIGQENFIEEKDVQALDDDDFVLVGRY
ncbi:unnamed protein product [Cuscuta campestris]|uniref:4-hydroxy-tetrahydrodipicolinate synthase n=1 Tax=Cuscuta campestris TaxID=132261 RepID=A0A484LAM0_9ASTE|nr:unnamed protein product [Cuscuta campestris]